MTGASWTASSTAPTRRASTCCFSVVKAPQWARPAGDTDQGPPADPNTYGTFMREMAARYKGRVKAYEIWNEQNLYYEWGGRGGKLNAARYVELLKAAYQRRQVGRSRRGGHQRRAHAHRRQRRRHRHRRPRLPGADVPGRPGALLRRRRRAPQRLQQPARRRLAHLQRSRRAQLAKGHPSWFFRGTMESYRNIMVKYGDGGKRIWPTEFGWATVEGLGVRAGARL